MQISCNFLYLDGLLCAVINLFYTYVIIINIT